MIDWLYEHPDHEGIYNCVAPNVISNVALMKTLRQVTGHSYGLPAMTWLLEAGALLIGTETELMLKSRWAIPRKAMQEGFTFKYPMVKEALQEILPALQKY
jgi:NAD dependent epimerase/dehydratase family enzyme